jgi:hypothetical protein
MFTVRGTLDGLPYTVAVTDDGTVEGSGAVREEHESRNGG